MVCNSLSGYIPSCAPDLFFLQTIYRHTFSSEYKPPWVYILYHLGMCKAPRKKRFGRRWKLLVSELEKESLLSRFGGCAGLKLKIISRVQEEIHFTRGCEPSSLFAVHPKSLKWKILARA